MFLKGVNMSRSCNHSCSNQEILELETRPFSDTKMKYVKAEHRYVLKQSYLKKRDGNLTDLLGSDTEAEKFLDDVSEKMYTFIYNTANVNCQKNNIRVKEYLLANDHDIRGFIAKALFFQASASANTDIDKLGEEHRIKLDSGTRVNIKFSDSLSNSCLQALGQSEILFDGIYTDRIRQEDFQVGY